MVSRFFSRCVVKCILPVCVILFIAGMGYVPQVMAAPEPDWALPGQAFIVDNNTATYRGIDCSVGFAAWDASGNRYFITNDACFYDEHFNRALKDGQPLEVFDANDHGQTYPIGREVIYTPTSDAGRAVPVSLVKLYPGRRLEGGGGWHNIPHKPVNARVGEQACLVAERSDQPRCGTITVVNQNFDDPDDPTNSTEGNNLVVGYCTWGG